MVRQEVADTNGTDNLFFVKLFQGPPCGQVFFLPFFTVCFGHGPVEQAKIQIVCSQVLQGVFHACHGGVIGQIITPYLCGQENVFSGDAGSSHTCAHFFFIHVHPRGVQMAVANGKGCFHNALCRLVDDFIGAEAHFGDFHAVI